MPNRTKQPGSSAKLLSIYRICGSLKRNCCPDGFILQGVAGWGSQASLNIFPHFPQLLQVTSRKGRVEPTKTTPHHRAFGREGKRYAVLIPTSTTEREGSKDIYGKTIRVLSKHRAIHIPAKCHKLLHLSIHGASFFRTRIAIESNGESVSYCSWGHAQGVQRVFASAS